MRTAQHEGALGLPDFEFANYPDLVGKLFLMLTAKEFSLKGWVASGRIANGKKGLGGLHFRVSSLAMENLRVVACGCSI